MYIAIKNKKTLYFFYNLYMYIEKNLVKSRPIYLHENIKNIKKYIK